MVDTSILARKTCRSCGQSDLKPILSLGEHCPINFVTSVDERNISVPFELILCPVEEGGCGLLQMKYTTPSELLWNDQYWYKSGISSTIRNDLADIVDKAKRLAQLREGDLVIDIGCNDGTLLRFYEVHGVITLGYEPSKNVAKEAKEGTSRILNTFFPNYKCFQEEFGSKKAKIITAISMFYDLEDPNPFLKDIIRMLDKDGVFIIQQNYLASMLKQNAFDNICHEHLEYYSLFSLEKLLNKHGLEVFDVELNDINGGSIRTYIRFKDNISVKSFEGAEDRLSKIRKGEEAMALNTEAPYRAFATRVNKIKKQLTDFIKQARKDGKKIWIYGASTRGSTTLQYCGIDHMQIEAAADMNPDKWGKKTIAGLIPIFSPEEFRKANPDYLIVLTWHFFDEIKKQEKEWYDAGGKFVVPMPEFRII